MMSLPVSFAVISRGPELRIRAQRGRTVGGEPFQHGDPGPGAPSLGTEAFSLRIGTALDEILALVAAHDAIFGADDAGDGGDRDDGDDHFERIHVIPPARGAISSPGRAAARFRD